MEEQLKKEAEDALFGFVSSLEKTFNRDLKTGSYTKDELDFFLVGLGTGLILANVDGKYAIKLANKVRELANYDKQEEAKKTGETKKA